MFVEFIRPFKKIIMKIMITMCDLLLRNLKSKGRVTFRKFITVIIAWTYSGSCCSTLLSHWKQKHVNGDHKAMFMPTNGKYLYTMKFQHKLIVQMIAKIIDKKPILFFWNFDDENTITWSVFSTIPFLNKTIFLNK